MTPTIPEYLAPGVYIEELPTGTHPIEAVATSVVSFIGVSTQPGLLSAVTSTTEFERSAPADSTQYLRSAVHGFFQNAGTRCSIVWIAASDPIDAALAASSPAVVAQIGFTEWTPDGHLRHSRFVGLREDKAAREVVRESGSGAVIEKGNNSQMSTVLDIKK